MFFIFRFTAPDNNNNNNNDNNISIHEWMQMYFRHVKTKQKLKWVRQINIVKWNNVYFFNKHWHAWKEQEEVDIYLIPPLLHNQVINYNQFTSIIA